MGCGVNRFDAWFTERLGLGLGPIEALTLVVGLAFLIALFTPDLED